MGQCMRPPKNSKHSRNPELNQVKILIKKPLEYNENKKKGNESQATSISNNLENQSYP